MLVVMIVGLLMMPGRGMLPGLSPMGGTFGIFRIVWIAFGLIGAGAAFYNAFSKNGMPLYEIEMEDEGEALQTGGGPFCPKCGKPVGKSDKFCRNCGTAL
jgi:hypothetical protein